jgi:hypothetical protein
MAVVLGSSATAWGQATVREEPTAQQPTSAIRAAARDRRSISLSNESMGEGGGAVDVPEFHTVERGDTLWDITGYYFQNPWRWPAVWGLNPQITNPHWIFPGDQVRLLPSGFVTPTAAPSQNLSSGAPSSLNAPRRSVAPQTVFLREQGWIDESQREAAGTIVGSPDDQLLLSEGDQAYVDFANRTPHVGEQYTIFQEGQRTRDGDRVTGTLVRVLGTATVEHWDPHQHVATARITESLDGIERGERVAAIPRRIDVVPPQTNSVELRGHIVATVQPRELVGQHMVVFIDRGESDHVQVGNRFFVVRRGDALQATLHTPGQHVPGSGIDRDGDGNVDNPPGHVRPADELPEEVVGEVLVLEVRPHSATGLVTSSVVETEVGDQLEMRRGY